MLGVALSFGDAATTCTGTTVAVLWVLLPTTVAVTSTVASPLWPSPTAVGSVLRLMVRDAVSLSSIRSVVAMASPVSAPVRVAVKRMFSPVPSSMSSSCGLILIVVDASVWPAVMVTASGVSLATPIRSVDV